MSDRQTLGPLQRDWITKLRSGQYPQTKGYLHDEFGYCCQGLALEHVLGVEPVGEDKGICRYEADFGRVTNTLPLEYATAIGLRDPKITSLAELNDAGFTFAEIADLIEAHPSAFFREAR